jgi:2-(3-amino-3-carboxypropyl)histidine synthase
MKLLLQFPEGLKQEAMKYAAKYEREGHEVYLSAAPCYGACDIALDEAKWIGADKLIHFGHAKFMKKDSDIPIEYVEYHLQMDLKKLSVAVAALKPFKKIALGTTVQYTPQVKEIKAYLEKQGKIVLTGKGHWAIHEAQILGCDALAVTQFEKGNSKAGAECADAILFIGDGDFHSLAIDSDLPVFVFHPKSGNIQQINEEIARARKRKRGAILKASEAQSFGIIISTKPGQFNQEYAKWAKHEIEKRGRSAALLVSNELEPLSLNNFLSFDAYVTTACPRLSEDTEEFGKPVLDMKMLKDTLDLIDAIESEHKKKKTRKSD